jgi:hypothetical protein
MHGTRHSVLHDGKKFTETMICTPEKDAIRFENLERKDADDNEVQLVVADESVFAHTSRSPRTSPSPLWRSCSF